MRHTAVSWSASRCSGSGASGPRNARNPRDAEERVGLAGQRQEGQCLVTADVPGAHGQRPAVEHLGDPGQGLHLLGHVRRLARAANSTSVRTRPEPSAPLTSGRLGVGHRAHVGQHRDASAVAGGRRLNGPIARTRGARPAARRRRPATAAPGRRSPRSTAGRDGRRRPPAARSRSRRRRLPAPVNSGIPREPATITPWPGPAPGGHDDSGHLLRVDGRRCRHVELVDDQDHGRARVGFLRRMHR